jgi:hypothetical protein
MQFIENGPEGTRAAILRLRSPDSRCEITLLPLIEGVGRAYDEAILHELERQDVILSEPGSTSQSAQDSSLQPRLALTTQRAILRDAHERDGLSASLDAAAPNFGQWWQGFPVGGGPHTSIALYRTVVMAASRGPKRVGSELAKADEMRLRQMILDAPDGSIEETIDRLHEALKRQALFVAILLNPRHLDATAMRLRLQHRFRVIERIGLPAVGDPSIPDDPAFDPRGMRLLKQLSKRRERAQALLAIKWAARLSLITVLVLGGLAFTVYAIVNWSAWSYWDIYRPYG